MTLPDAIALSLLLTAPVFTAEPDPRNAAAPSARSGRTIGGQITIHNAPKEYLEQPNDPAMEFLVTDGKKITRTYRIWFEGEKLCWSTPKTGRRCSEGKP